MENARRSYCFRGSTPKPLETLRRRAPVKAKAIVTLVEVVTCKKITINEKEGIYCKG